jgi:hypothetical protein
MGGNVLLGLQGKDVQNPEEISAAKWMIVLPKKSVDLAAIRLASVESSLVEIPGEVECVITRRTAF